MSSSGLFRIRTIAYSQMNLNAIQDRGCILQRHRWVSLNPTRRTTPWLVSRLLRETLKVKVSGAFGVLSLARVRWGCGQTVTPWSEVTAATATAAPCPERPEFRPSLEPKAAPCTPTPALKSPTFEATSTAHISQVVVIVYDSDCILSENYWKWSMFRWHWKLFVGGRVCRRFGNSSLTKLMKRWSF